MARYTPDSRDRVRDAIDFVELVNTRTELRRAGPRSYEGLCPFHDERTPSFSVEPMEKVYYCFGCQASGDVFTFVQETEGVDFKGALELLADRAGIELQVEKEDPREAERRVRRERLLELLSRTASYYERYLSESDEAAHARTYLLERGLSEEILKASCSRPVVAGIQRKSSTTPGSRSAHRSAGDCMTVFALASCSHWRICEDACWALARGR
jgi:DNA primase